MKLDVIGILVRMLIGPIQYFSAERDRRFSTDPVVTMQRATTTVSVVAMGCMQAYRHHCSGGGVCEWVKHAALAVQVGQTDY